MFGLGKGRGTRRRPPNDPLYAPRPRVLESASYVEIAARTKALESPLRATAYVIEDRIIVSQSIGHGLNVEVGDPAILSADVDDELLGRTLCDQLLAFRRGPIPELRDHMLSDWPAYRASGVRSAKQFEAKGYRVSLRTAGDSIELKAAPMTSLHAEIGVAATARPDHASLGAQFRRVLRGALALRAAEIV